jgi:hypothetical protein
LALGGISLLSLITRTIGIKTTLSSSITDSFNITSYFTPYAGQSSAFLLSLACIETDGLI